MDDVCRFSRDHVVECSERTVLSCLVLSKHTGSRQDKTVLSCLVLSKHTGSRQDKTVLSEHSTITITNGAAWSIEF